MAAYSLDSILTTVYESEGSIDIREHLDTLTYYASKCEHVTELGVRWVVSTWYFIAGKPKTLNSFDITHVSEYGVNEAIIKSVAKENGVDFNFIQEDVLTTDKIIETDLLFIDTLHNYKQLKMELKLHGNKAKKYLIFHDIVSFGEEDETESVEAAHWPTRLKDYYRSLENRKGINHAIVDFLTENRHWVIDKLSTRSNGLLVLRRDENAKD